MPVIAITKIEETVLRCAAEYAIVLKSLKAGHAPLPAYNAAMMALLEAAEKLKV